MYVSKTERHSMYLRKTKTKDKRIYLSIAHSYRRSDGTNTAKTVKSLGYVDDFIAQGIKDPISHFKAVCKEMNENAAKENEPVLIKFFPKKKIDTRNCNQIELGSAIPSAYFHRVLGIWDFFEKKRTSRKFKYDPCRILEMLVWDRISHPSSKLEAWQNKDKYPRKCDFGINDVYRCLTYLQKNAAALVKSMNEAYENVKGKRNKTKLYYDVTNYYFEIDYEDEGEEGLRKRGVSKEHRPNPIVQMGLLLDGDGMPFDYEIFPGNVNDMQTMMPIMKKAKLREDLENEHIIVVADKGLNTSNNIASCVLDGNGFIFSQSVRKATKQLKKWVLNQDGYEQNEAGTFKIKSRFSEKIVHIEGDDGKKHDVKIPVKEVAFWSKNFYDRSRHERLKVIKKSSDAIKRADYSSACAHSKIRYAKDVPFVKETGEVAVHNWVLDEQKIARDEEMDGYYCIITSEENMPDDEVIRTYRGLSKIEESFRVMKSDFDARPVFCSTEDHIKAHFLICYVALFIMRLMQFDTDKKHSATEISKSLSQVVGHKMDANCYLFDYYNEVVSDLSKAVSVDLSKQMLTKSQIRKIMASVKK